MLYWFLLVNFCKFSVLTKIHGVMAVQSTDLLLRDGIQDMDSSKYSPDAHE